jgi:AraC-like DNA-binding protein
MKNASDSKLPLYINCCGNEKEISENSSVCRPTGRSDYLLLYVPVGGIRLCVREREIICPEKTVILYRPYEPQSYRFFGNDHPENFWVHFAGREAGAILKRFSLDSQTVFSLTATQGLEDLFLQMIAECQSAKPYSQEAASLILQTILLFVARNSSETKRSDEEHARSTRSDVHQEITRAINYFNEQYAQRIDVEEYARSLHMSACWFIKTFKRYTYTTPKQYVLNLRLAKAKELLESSTLSISEIAAAVGFSEVTYFSRLFKRSNGVSPLTYRQRNW